MIKKWKMALIWVIGIAIVGLIVFVGMKKSVENKIIEEQVDKMTSDFVDDEANDYAKAKAEGDAYYNEKSIVLNVIDVKKSSTVQTERQIIKDFKDRGFGDYPIYTNHSIDGEYFNDKEVSDSNERHPSYQTNYVSSNNELWSIISMNGCIVASPLSFNFGGESGLNVMLVIAESEKIMCYDSSTNTFYETIPYATEGIVKIVDKINTETLDKLTVDVIKGL